MGIYIPGVEMPEKCGCCFAAFPDGVGHSCCLIKSYPTIDNQKGRRSDCPLVPVQEHGRLIDADEMRDEWLISGENDYIYDTNSFLDSIDNAPTIIEAEWKNNGTA